MANGAVRDTSCDEFFVFCGRRWLGQHHIFGRFWPKNLGPAPIAKLIESPRCPMGPKETEVPVDETLLEAGDHNGSTFFQHQKFLEVVKGNMKPEVNLDDGIWAVRMGLAAQQSAASGKAVDL